MSSVPARYEVSGERRNPKPSGRTSSVPSPYIESPFLARFFRSAKISSCLRSRLAPSISLAIAISTSSVTWRFFRSDRCIGYRYSEGVVRRRELREQGLGGDAARAPVRHAPEWVRLPDNLRLG